MPNKFSLHVYVFIIYVSFFWKGLCIISQTSEQLILCAFSIVDNLVNYENATWESTNVVENKKLKMKSSCTSHYLIWNDCVLEMLNTCRKFYIDLEDGDLWHNPYNGQCVVRPGVAYCFSSDPIHFQLSALGGQLVSCRPLPLIEFAFTILKRDLWASLSLDYRYDYDRCFPFNLCCHRYPFHIKFDFDVDTIHCTGICRHEPAKVVEM